MVFHVINLINNKIEHYFVQIELELANREINDDSIIYQGESHWIPEKVKDSNKYSNRQMAGLGQVLKPKSYLNYKQNTEI